MHQIRPSGRPPGRPSRRLLMLALSLLSGCAAARVGDGGPHATASTPYGAYLIGRFAQDSTDIDLAARNLLAALAHDPDNATLLNQAFMACMLDSRPEAVTLAARLPDNPVAVLLLGDTAARAGDWAGARAHYAAMPPSGLSKLLSPLLVAWSQAGQADVDGALATLQPLMGNQPLAALYLLHSAMIADLGNRFPQAQAMYAQALTVLGPNLRVGRILANWEMRQGHADDADATLRALGVDSPGLAIVVPGLIAEVKQRPVRSATDGLAEAYLSFAAEIRQQSGNDGSLALLRLALDLRPDLTAARMLMADVLEKDKHPDAALRTLASVGNGDALAPLVRLRRADLQHEMGDDTAAAATLRQLAASMPDRPEPLAALAELQRGEKQLAASITTYDKALALAPAKAPQNWALLFSRAVSEQQLGDWGAAQNDLQQALKLAPDQPEVLNFLGYSWADRNENLPQARAMIGKAASMRPNDGAIIDSLGWVLLREGDVQGAVKSLERAVQIEPEDPEINGHLGDAYWAAGFKLQARYQWQLALNLKPDAAAIPKLQAKLADAERATR